MTLLQQRAAARRLFGEGQYEYIIPYRANISCKGAAMAASRKRTFSLPGEQSRYIDDLVSSGAYASGSEVVRAGLRALQERDAAVERWLREEVVPVAAAMRDDPGRAIPAVHVFDDIRDFHARRTRKSRTDA